MEILNNNTVQLFKDIGQKLCNLYSIEIKNLHEMNINLKCAFDSIDFNFDNSNWIETQLQSSFIEPPDFQFISFTQYEEKVLKQKLYLAIFDC